MRNRRRVGVWKTRGGGGDEEEGEEGDEEETEPDVSSRGCKRTPKRSFSGLACTASKTA